MELHTEKRTAPFVKKKQEDSEVFELGIGRKKSAIPVGMTEKMWLPLAAICCFPVAEGILRRFLCFGDLAGIVLFPNKFRWSMKISIRYSLSGCCIRCGGDFVYGAMTEMRISTTAISNSYNGTMP